MKKIAFRADAKPSIGTGDLVSLINLSAYFNKKGWETHFIIRDHKAAIELLKGRGIKRYSVLDERISIEEEVVKINDYVERNGIGVIFFEITERRLAEYKGITDKAVKACVSFDGDVPLEMGLVVDWDVNANEVFGKRKHPDTVFLFGMEYVILPVEFDFKRIFSRTYKSKPRTILIAMGGADELNFTGKVVETLIKNNTGFNLNIVIGSGYMFEAPLREQLKTSSVEYEINKNIANMFEEFMRCDAAIAAGGLTSFELIASRTPAALIATYEHQVPRCAYFGNKGWATYLGFRAFDEKALMESIRNPKTDLPKNVFKTERIEECADELLSRH